jgi:hypothetical protein
MDFQACLANIASKGVLEFVSVFNEDLEWLSTVTLSRSSSKRNTEAVLNKKSKRHKIEVEPPTKRNLRSRKSPEPISRKSPEPPSKKSLDLTEQADAPGTILRRGRTVQGKELKPSKKASRSQKPKPQAKLEPNSFPPQNDLDASICNKQTSNTRSDFNVSEISAVTDNGISDTVSDAITTKPSKKGSKKIKLMETESIILDSEPNSLRVVDVIHVKPSKKMSKKKLQMVEGIATVEEKVSEIEIPVSKATIAQSDPIKGKKKKAKGKTLEERVQLQSVDASKNYELAQVDSLIECQTAQKSGNNAKDIVTEESPINSLVTGENSTVAVDSAQDDHYRTSHTEKPIVNVDTSLPTSFPLTPLQHSSGVVLKISGLSELSISSISHASNTSPRIITEDLKSSDNISNSTVTPTSALTSLGIKIDKTSISSNSNALNLPKLPRLTDANIISQRNKLEPNPNGERVPELKISGGLEDDRLLAINTSTSQKAKESIMAKLLPVTLESNAQKLELLKKGLAVSKQRIKPRALPAVEPTQQTSNNILDVTIDSDPSNSVQISQEPNDGVNLSSMIEERIKDPQETVITENISVAVDSKVAEDVKLSENSKDALCINEKSIAEITISHPQKIEGIKEPQLPQDEKNKENGALISIKSDELKVPSISTEFKPILTKLSVPKPNQSPIEYAPPKPKLEAPKIQPNMPLKTIIPKPVISNQSTGLPKPKIPLVNEILKRQLQSKLPVASPSKAKKILQSIQPIQNPILPQPAKAPQSILDSKGEIPDIQE